MVNWSAQSFLCDVRVRPGRPVEGGATYVRYWSSCFCSLSPNVVWKDTFSSGSAGGLSCRRSAAEAAEAEAEGVGMSDASCTEVARLLVAGWGVVGCQEIN